MDLAVGDGWGVDTGGAWIVPPAEVVIADGGFGVKHLGHVQDGSLSVSQSNS